MRSIPHPFLWRPFNLSLQSLCNWRQTIRCIKSASWLHQRSLIEVLISSTICRSWGDLERLGPTMMSSSLKRCIPSSQRAPKPELSLLWPLSTWKLLRSLTKLIGTSFAALVMSFIVMLQRPCHLSILQKCLTTVSGALLCFLAIMLRLFVLPFQHRAVSLDIGLPA